MATSSNRIINQKIRTPSKNIILLCEVDSGLGDYGHFVDLYREFRTNPFYQNYQFIPIIGVEVGRLQEFKEKLDKLNEELPMPRFYLFESFHYYENSALQQDLRSAEQIYLISYFFFPHLDKYEKYFNPKAICKKIGEHELSTDLIDQKNLYEAIFEKEKAIKKLKEWVNTSRWLEFPMGISKGRNGLLLKKELPRLSTTEALKYIQVNESNNTFIEKLLLSSESQLDTFEQNNTLIPAYYNEITSFRLFLKWLLINKDTLINPSIYLSGLKFSLSDLQSITSFIATSGIKQIELITPDKHVQQTYNTSGSFIRIFIDFKLGDASYEAIFRQAKVSGPSGDKSFEKSISYQVFPFYISTNHGVKFIGLLELANIIREDKDYGIPDDIKEHYCKYFELFRRPYSPYGNDTKLFCPSTRPIFDLDEKKLNEFYNIDLKRMIEHWPKVARLLYEKHNLYNELQRIFLEATHVHQLPYKDKTVIFNADASDHMMEHKIPPLVSAQSSKRKISINQLCSTTRKVENNTNTNLFELMDRHVTEKSHPIYLLGKAIHENNQAEILSLIESNSLDVFQSSKYKAHMYSPILIAAQEGNVDILQILVTHKFDVNFTNSMSAFKRALSYAAANNHQNAWNFLIAMGANPNIKDNFNNTPTDYWKESLLSIQAQSAAESVQRGKKRQRGQISN